jgi:4'-phosphopantetheinyl transferase EntD
VSEPDHVLARARLAVVTGEDERERRSRARSIEHWTGRALLAMCRRRLGAPGEWATQEPFRSRTVLGSITHGGRLVVAVAAHTSRCSAIGVDVEPAEPLPPEVRAALLDADEQRLADDLEHGPGDTIVFTAKEAAFKALSLPPATMARISVRAGAGPRSLRVRVPETETTAPRDLLGSWMLEEGHVVTVVRAAPVT